MSLKDNLEYIKNEIIGEGKALDFYIKVEQFIKRKKKVVLSFAIALLAATVTGITFTVMQNNRIHAANTALNEYLQNPNEASLQTIKDNNTYLYQLLKLKEKPQDQATLDELANSNFDLVKHLARYQKFSLGLEQDKFNTYNSAFLKDYANFSTAFYFLQKGDYKKARSYLDGISSEFGLYDQVKYLKHYGVNAK